MVNEIKADLSRYPGTSLKRVTNALRSAAFYPLVVYRIGYDLYHRWPRPAALLGKLPYKFAAFLTEWATGISLAPDAQIGPGLYIGHWGGITVGSNVKLGAQCNISPMVIMGFGALNGRTGVPEIGDRVYVAAGAKIVGPIKVGSDVAVGANAVVCRDVPDHVSVGGVPAKIISRKGSAPYLQVGQRVEVAPARARSASDLEDLRRINAERVRADSDAEEEQESGREKSG